MIMGHIGFGGHFDKFIHAFHMPLFFFVSGYFYQKKDIAIGSYIRHKIQTLLIPYVSTGFICYIVWLLLNRHHLTVAPLYHLLWENTDGLPIAGALWFLTALFICNVVYFLLDQKLHSIKLLTLCILFFALAGNLLPSLLPFRLPWAMDTAFVGMGLFHAARLMRLYESKLIIDPFKLPLGLTALCGVIITILIFVNGAVNLRVGTYAHIPLFWVNAIGASLVGWNVSRYIDRWQGKCGAHPVSWLRSVGKDSLVYLCWNQMVILVLMHFEKPLQSVGLRNSLIHGLIFLGTLIVLWGINRLFKIGKMGKLLGK